MNTTAQSKFNALPKYNRVMRRKDMNAFRVARRAARKLAEISNTPDFIRVLQALKG